ncbi:putative Ent-kaurene oxidase [Glarea lozoyensis 74030]|nr:putative Ent-kaurene oxidase [Glarea lozoyensis 74030]
MEQKVLDQIMDEPKKSVDEEQSAFTGWVLKYTKDSEKRDPAVLALNQIVLSFAAIHTSGMAVTHCLYDLAARPEYIQPLREEIEKVIAEDGYEDDGDGIKKLKKSSLPRLRKLDSFMKESQRHAPAGLFGNTRVVVKPLHLSTGHTIPPGTKIAYNLWATQMSTSSLSMSPTYNPPNYHAPAEFDGFRFSNLRAMEGKENKHQFVSTAPDSLSFGHGNHACPGRFFASNEIKVILIEVLRTYDLRLKGDVEGTGGVEKRPEDLVNAGSIMPNPFAEIEFKSRKKDVI